MLLTHLSLGFARTHDNRILHAIAGSVRGRGCAISLWTPALKCLLVIARRSARPGVWEVRICPGFSDACMTNSSARCGGRRRRRVKVSVVDTSILTKKFTEGYAGRSMTGMLCLRHGERSSAGHLVYRQVSVGLANGTHLREVRIHNLG
jgi:hypothetical protein